MRSCHLVPPAVASLLFMLGCSSPQWAPAPASSRAMHAEPPPGQGTTAPELPDEFGDDDDDADADAAAPVTTPPPTDGGVASDGGQPAQPVVPEPVEPAPKP